MSIANNTSTLRPGLLVSLKTSLTGNVQYVRTDLDNEVDGKLAKARWETQRTIADHEEHERATKARNKARSLIVSVCAKSAFGLLCPENAASDLDAAIDQARKVTEAFNETAKLTRVHVYVIAGKVAADDAEAARAIASEVRDLMSAMEKGIANCDVKVIREAAAKAKDVGQMLSPAMQARVQVAVDVARASAKKIVQAGEQAAQEIDQTSIRKITESRTAFLDMDDQQVIAAPAQETRALDFEVQQ